MTKRQPRVLRKYADGGKVRRHYSDLDEHKGDDKQDFNDRVRWAVEHGDEHEMRHAIKKRTSQVD